MSCDKCRVAAIHIMNVTNAYNAEKTRARELTDVLVTRLHKEKIRNRNSECVMLAVIVMLGLYAVFA